MKVHEALANAFAGEGVTAVFGLMGDGNMHWMADLEKHPQVKVFNVRHEGAGLTMADGWARTTGMPGVCTTTSGPGFAQLSTALLVASRNATPVVVFAGDRPAGDDHHQVLDQRRLAEAAEAGFVQVNGTADAYDAVRMAFHMARTESRPIVLNAPMDVQGMTYDGPDQYEPSNTLLPALQRTMPDRAQLEAAAAMLAAARKPVIVAGRGAELAGAREAILKLGERVGALLATTLLVKGFLSPNDFDAGVAGLYATQVTAELFGEADCVLAIGASLHSYTLAGGYLFGDARFIQIDNRPQVIMGNGRVADCYLQADARGAVEALDELLAKQGVKSTGYRTPEVRAALQGEIDPVVFEVEPGTVDPREASTLLDEILPENVGVVIGSGHYSSFPTMMMRRRRRPAIFTKAFGCVGQGLATAIGASVAAKRPVALFEGDTSIMMHVQELDTAARYGIPILVVVMNDEALGSEYHKLKAHHMNQDLAHVPSPDLGAVARAFGLRGSLVRDIGDFRKALEDFAKNPGPMLIDLRVSRNVISVPYRRAHFGQVA